MFFIAYFIFHQKIGKLFSLFVGLFYRLWVPFYRLKINVEQMFSISCLFLSVLLRPCHLGLLVYPSAIDSIHLSNSIVDEHVVMLVIQMFHLFTPHCAPIFFDFSFLSFLVSLFHITIIIVLSWHNNYFPDFSSLLFVLQFYIVFHS